VVARVSECAALGRVRGVARAGGPEGWVCWRGLVVRFWGWSGLMLGWSVLELVVGVYAGLVLSAVVVCVTRIFSLSLLATVRGGTSFLCPKRQRNEAKKALLKHATLSVHSVQFLFIGAPKARCSPERRMCEPLLLANPDMNTLRHQCSRASTFAKDSHGLTRTRNVVLSYENALPSVLSGKHDLPRNQPGLTRICFCGSSWVNYST
jgi:hypothetical protein